MNILTTTRCNNSDYTIADMANTLKVSATYAGMLENGNRRITPKLYRSITEVYTLTEAEKLKLKNYMVRQFEKSQSKKLMKFINEVEDLR